MAGELTYSQMRYEDRGKVLDFLRLAYPETPRQSDPEFWDWHYLGHPNARRDEIPVWLCMSGERLVGQLATIPVKLNVDGELHPAIWILDLMVDPEFRRRGIMKKLVLEANKQYAYMLGSATRKQHSAAMLMGLGWTVFSNIPRYHKILFPGNALRDLHRLSPVRAAANAVLMPTRRRYRVTDPSVRPLNGVEAIGEFWENAREQWPVSISRSTEYLRWQFERQPGKRFEFLGYYEDDKLCGYAILYFRKPTASGIVDKAAISDLCYLPECSDKSISALLNASISLAIRKRAGGIVTDMIDRRVEARLKKLGFRSIESGLEVMAIGPGEQISLYDPDRWHLTRADSDISIFEEPNLSS